MSYNTYDRFQGCWWGATLAPSLTNRLSPQSHLDLYSQPWLVQRQKLATMLLEGESWGDLEKFVGDLPQSTIALQHNSSLLSLLPLIIFPHSHKLLRAAETVDRPVEELTKIGITRNILLWRYLVVTALNARLALISQKQLIKEIDRHHQPVIVPVIKLLFEALEKGSSLSLVVEQLSAMKDLELSAIALAWYCFATTPLDFKLSVRRAALVPSNLAWLATTLTGTLSGAYNGMAEISAFSRNEQNQEQLEHRLCQELYADWLGIFNVRANNAYNPNLDAIAPARMIQPRQNLKIISQISTLK